MARAYAAAAVGILSRDLSVFLSYRTVAVTQVLSIFFSLSLFYFISRLVQVGSIQSDDYYAYVVVGLLILNVVTSTLTSSAGSVRQELVAGTFERMILSPFGAVASLMSMMLFPLVFAMLLSLVTLGTAALVFGVQVEWSTAWLAAPVAVLGALAFVPFGLFITASVLAVKQAAGAASFIIAGISIVSGMYFPVTLLPSWIEWLSEVQPFTPAVDLVRHLLVGTNLNDPAWLELLKLTGFAVILIVPSLWVVNRAIERGRRRGTIIEY